MKLKVKKEIKILHQQINNYDHNLATYVIVCFILRFSYCNLNCYILLFFIFWVIFPV